MTAIRRALLNEVDSGALDAPDIWLPLASAIGQQGFLNEYVFDVTGEENAQVLALRDAVAASLQRGEAVAPIQVAVLAGYLPLHTLAGAERLASGDWPAPVAALVNATDRPSLR